MPYFKHLFLKSELLRGAMTPRGWNRAGGGKGG
jgi:hypothetical protein